MFRITSIVLLWWAASGIGVAASVLRLEVNNIAWQGGTSPGYNVFDPGEYPQTVSFTVSLTGDPCSFFVTFGPGGQGTTGNRAATSGANLLSYEIYRSATDRTVLKDLPTATSNEVVSGTFGTGETLLEFSYALVVPPLQIVSAGSYTDSFVLTLYEGTPDSYVAHDSKTVSLSVQVIEVTELSLVNSGAAFDPNANARALDFGELTTGERQGFDLRVRSNAGYQVLLESENGGALQHLDPQAVSEVPYTLEIDGIPVSLGAGQQTGPSRSGRITDSEGDGHPVEVIIGDTTGAAAGTYRDNITITVISNL